jgi:hypothetical protein
MLALIRGRAAVSRVRAIRKVTVDDVMACPLDELRASRGQSENQEPKKDAGRHCADFTRSDVRKLNRLESPIGRRVDVAPEAIVVPRRLTSYDAAAGCVLR